MNKLRMTNIAIATFRMTTVTQTQSTLKEKYVPMTGNILGKTDKVLIAPFEIILNNYLT
jgi:hypothetical protein